MSRSVIEIRPFKDGAGNEGIAIHLSEPPDVYQDADTSVPLTCTAEDAEFVALSANQLGNDALRMAGQRLRQSLNDQPAVLQAISEAITRAKQAGTAFPIYLRLSEKTERIETLPWETLWDPQADFLALDKRWPIGRMSGGQLGGKIERPFNLPIRILAFLAASGIEARPEWDAFYSALTAAEICIHLQVYLCEPDLAEHILNLPANEYVTLDVDYIPQTFDFANLISNADESPHIIHFFCHGSTEGGPSLLLSTQADWEHSRSSIVLGPDEFSRIPGVENHLWLVTLNCCESAVPSQETRSFARTLVRDIKVPGVVAMREAVTVETAGTFCAAFYKSLFAEIKPALDSTTFIPIEWAKTLHDPRYAICKQRATQQQQQLLSAAASSKEWTLPVIYTRAEQLLLRGIPLTTPLNEHEQKRIKGQIETLREVIENLPQDVPPAAIAKLEQQIAQLEAQLFQH